MEPPYLIEISYEGTIYYGVLELSPGWWIATQTGSGNRLFLVPTA